jgi:NAD(P)-dependent dehydrogenase (short-subunit alcohol dehydrogenase family)
MRDFGGRVAVVTGGASGIGRALAERCAAEGMQVVIADVEQAALDRTAAELGVAGIQTDVSNAESVAALADAVLARFGRVDLVCNNAGVGGGGLMKDQTLNDWKWVLGVNLWGVVHGIQFFLPHLLANPEGGHIVNTASMAGLAAWPGIGPYNASKYAVVGLSETLAAELEADGARVKVSVLCPGWVRTNILDSQRNRPAELRNPSRAKADARQRNDQTREIFATVALDPAAVAGMVVEAVREDRFWVITHPDLLEPVRERVRRMG